MDKSRSIVLALVAAGLMGLGASYSLAQEAGGGGGGPAAGGGQGGGRGQGGGNWADMRQRMADRVKTELGANDEDWKVLQPAIEKVTTLQIQTRVGGRGMMGRGGQRGGGGAPAGQAAPANPIAETPTAKAGAELAKVLEDKGSSNDEVKAKLQALRAAREQARQELTKAQAELRDLVSLRQEATLVSMGLLD